MAVNKNAVVKQARVPLIAVHHCYNCCSDGFETLGCLLLTKISMAYPHSKLSKPSQGRALQTVRTFYPHTFMHVHVQNTCSVTLCAASSGRSWSPSGVVTAYTAVTHCPD